MFFRLITAFMGLALLLSTPVCSDDEIPYPSIPPFEKFYVWPHEILSTPAATYYITPCGEYIPVRTIRRDAKGRTYVIIIGQECPICGRCCWQKQAPEGYCCPFFEREVRPHYWCDH